MNTLAMLLASLSQASHPSHAERLAQNNQTFDNNEPDMFVEAVTANLNNALEVHGGVVTFNPDIPGFEINFKPGANYEDVKDVISPKFAKFVTYQVQGDNVEQLELRGTPIELLSIINPIHRAFNNLESGDIFLDRLKKMLVKEVGTAQFDIDVDSSGDATLTAQNKEAAEKIYNTLKDIIKDTPLSYLADREEISIDNYSLRKLESTLEQRALSFQR